jgi:ketosteroid isomerase-like protein
MARQIQNNVASSPDRAATFERTRSRAAFLLCAAGALLAMLTIGAGNAAAQKQQKPKKEKQKTDLGLPLTDSQAIDVAISQMLGAWQVGDVQEMHKYYADDVVVVSGMWEVPVVGWDSYARAYQAQISRTQGPHMDRINTVTKVMGDAAWATYQWRFTGRVDGTALDAVGHTTLVMQKRAGNWVIVLNHTSASPSLDPAPANAAPVSAAPQASPQDTAAARPRN